ADCYGPARPRLGAQPGGDPVGEVTQHRSKYVGLRGLPAERGLGSGRMRATTRLDLPRIAIPGKRRQLLANRTADHPLQRPSWQLRKLTDGEDAALVEPRLGGWPHAPHQLDREIMKEAKLTLWVDDHEAVRLGHLRGNLREMLG